MSVDAEPNPKASGMYRFLVDDSVGRREREVWNKNVEAKKQARAERRLDKTKRR